MSNKVRWIIGILCLGGLVTIYLTQHIDWPANIIYFNESVYRFIWNRTARFIANDFLAIGLLYALFPERKYVLFAFWVQLAGLVFLLLPYFLLKLHYPNYNGPLINFLHRIILNPTLILLIIPAFYWQKNNVTN